MTTHDRREEDEWPTLWDIIYMAFDSHEEDAQRMRLACALTQFFADVARWEALRDWSRMADVAARSQLRILEEKRRGGVMHRRAQAAEKRTNHLRRSVAFLMSVKYPVCRVCQERGFEVSRG